MAPRPAARRGWLLPSAVIGTGLAAGYAGLPGEEAEEEQAVTQALEPEALPPFPMDRIDPAALSAAQDPDRDLTALTLQLEAIRKALVDDINRRYAPYQDMAPLR